MRSGSKVVFGVFWALALTAGAQAAGCGGGDASSTDEVVSVGGMGGAGGSGLDGGVKGGAAGQGGAGGAKKDAGPMNCPPIKGQDPATLGDSCCKMGPAHCVDDSNVPGNLASSFDMCTSKTGTAGHCLPDTIIKAGSDYVPTPCQVPVFKVDGVCLSKCIPLIYNNANANLLNKATCTEGEVCVPCVSPLDNTPTGACELPAPGCPGPQDGGAGKGGGSGSGGAGGGSMCPYTGPQILDPKMFPECSPMCGGAHCLPSSLVPASQASQLGKCKAPDGTDGYCTPDPFIASAGNAVPLTCKSVGGVEGRCLSTCLPSIADQATLLPKDICGADEKCAPCFNPFADDPKAPTGACSLACDAAKNPPTEFKCPYTGPPVLDPSVFPACAPACGGAHCVPGSLIPVALQGQLATCTGGFCAPDTIVKTGGKANPSTCKSVGGVEGRCLSTCLPQIAAEASLLPKDTCGDNEKCAPCYDPTSATPNMPTGACSTGCDQPKDPPKGITCPYTGPPLVDPSTFPACSPACGGAHCVPATLVSGAQAMLLGKCTGADGKMGYCAPDSVVETAGQGVPKSCASVAGAEGRCLSLCLPDVAAQKDLLPQDVCGAEERCTPCFNPFATDPKAPTGACTLACDKPAKPPTEITCPYKGPPVIDVSKFPDCSPACGGAHCVPSSLISPDQATLLAPCAGGYCAPDSITASGGKAVPDTCTSIGGSEGRCVSTCLPSIADQADLLPQANCKTGEKCAPCFNPVAADPKAPTGACGIACDKPAQPPLTLTCPWTGPDLVDPSKFGPCSAPGCATAHCVPTSLVTDPAQASQLAACTTTQGSAGYCAPDFIVRAGGDGVPKSCTAFASTSAEGRCLPNCLPAVAAQASQLIQATCGTDELCTPCTDPLTGKDTGACKLACDKPKSPPYTFPTCCNDGTKDLGTCVPASDVPAGQSSNLQQDTCPANGPNLCAPDSLLPGAPALTGCKPSFLTFESKGVCLPDCLNFGFLGGLVLTQSTCDTFNKCVPCSKAPAGQQACQLAASSAGEIHSPARVCDVRKTAPYL